MCLFAIKVKKILPINVILPKQNFITLSVSEHVRLNIVRVNIRLPNIYLKPTDINLMSIFYVVSGQILVRH